MSAEVRRWTGEEQSFCPHVNLEAFRYISMWNSRIPLPTRHRPYSRSANARQPILRAQLKTGPVGIYITYVQRKSYPL